jgi:hypothetical protein
MRRGSVAVVLAAAVAVSAGSVSAVFGVVRAADSWGRAIEVPGLGALNADGSAGVISVSCGLAGSCAAGGDYLDASGHSQGFVVSERHGVWGRAVEVPGLGALNAGGQAEVVSVSCGPTGSCAAGGGYLDSSGSGQGFVVSERNGAWQKAIAVPGLKALNAGGSAQVSSVWCGPAGSCAAGGYYSDRSARRQGFVVSETKGAWQKASEVPGLGALNKGGGAQVNSVSCGPAGGCAAGGYYTDSHGHQQGFVT